MCRQQSYKKAVEMRPFTSPIAPVLIHVDDPEAGLEWYHQAFPGAERHAVTEFDFEYHKYYGVTTEIVPADEKVASGPAGTVVYWQTDNFQKRLDFLVALSATLYRSPVDIKRGKKMCHVRDLWGNYIGLKG